MSVIAKVEESVARGDSPDTTQRMIDEDGEIRRELLVRKARKLFQLKEQFDLWDDAFDQSLTWTRNGLRAGPRLQMYPFSAAYANNLNRPSFTSGAYINLFQLNMIRAYSRAFCLLNPYWWAIQQNLANYVVENGHSYTVCPRVAGKKVPDEKLQDVQDIVDRTCNLNFWVEYQCEKLRRGDRDGEFILRKFKTEVDGKLELIVRFMEPRLLWDPPGVSTSDNVWFGIKFADDDYESPEGYYFRPADYLGNTDTAGNTKWRQMVAKEEIQHRKFNVDRNSPRGLPSTYTISDRLAQALKTVQAMGKMVHFREKVAMVRQHLGATLSAINAYLGQEPKTPTGVGTVNSLHDLEGDSLIFDTNGNTQLTFPSPHLETDKIVYAVKAELQASAAAFGLAEFIFADPSGGKFASSIVSEGPMDKTIRRRQGMMIRDDIELLEEAVRLAGESNGSVDSDILKLVKITANPPPTVSRNRLTDTQADQLLVQSGAMSPQTMGVRAQLDADEEIERIKQHNKEFPPEVAGGAGGLGGRTLPGRQKSTMRPMGGKDEPGPKANPQKSKEDIGDGIDEGSHDLTSKGPLTQEDIAMGTAVITPEWLRDVKGDILALPANSDPPRSAMSVVASEYESGVPGVYLGLVEGQRVIAVDMNAMRVKHSIPDLLVAGNSHVLSFVPADVILIDWNIKPMDKAHNILHELVEQKLMSSGWAYARAHKYASLGPGCELDWLVDLQPHLASLRS